MLDQPAGLLARMGYILDVFNAHDAWRMALLSYPGEKIKEWEAKNAGAMYWLAKVRELKEKIAKWQAMSKSASP